MKHSNPSHKTGKPWADLSADEVNDLITESRRSGWRPALKTVSSRAPFFSKRMQSLGLGNWHMLLLEDRAGSALDVGCGFGSLPLGLAHYYRMAIGAEFLPDRVAYASLRARQDGRALCRFLRSTGHALPFEMGSFVLVTMNGVLEWAGLYSDGNPRDLQVAMLEEAKRVLKPDGHVAVAIENRFAVESILGMPDTHTGVIWPTVLPRWLANGVTRLRKGEPYRTYLYNPGGYRSLFRQAGFGSVRILDLISSYNDYDFIVDVDDVASYGFLFRNRLVRSFFGAAGKVRSALSRVWPSALKHVSYAYLVLGGTSTKTVLDEAHPLWRDLRDIGGQPGKFRFACPGEEPGQLTIICHDGTQAISVIRLSVDGNTRGRPFPKQMEDRFALSAGPARSVLIRGVHCEVFAVATAGTRQPVDEPNVALP